MDKVMLAATSREERGRKTNKGRREGLVPAVVYGHKVESKSLWINALDIKRLLRKSGESTIIDLQIDGKDDRNVLIHEIQRHSIGNQFTHIDFFQVNMAEKIETEVELVFIGESKAVKEMGGILVKNIDKVMVKCLPANLPSHIDVDISLIDSFEKHLTIGDLKVSAGVELEIDLETVVALVTPPRTEEDLAKLEDKVDADVTKVEGVVKPEAPVEEKKDKK